MVTFNERSSGGVGEGDDKEWRFCFLISPADPQGSFKEEERLASFTFKDFGNERPTSLAWAFHPALMDSPEDSLLSSVLTNGGPGLLFKKRGQDWAWEGRVSQVFKDVGS